ncbi:MAG: TerB family tellurite resistance protein [Anaerolineae bacterium]|nr:TerB family tellurite resistance protein [Anaerolineae bacterium]
MYIAKVDGEFSQQERDLYYSILKRMSFDEHERRDFQKLVDNEDNILIAIRELEDDAASQTLLDLLVLMAAFDGKVADEERQFLEKVSNSLGIPIDIEVLEAQATEYRIQKSNSKWNAVVNATSSSLGAVKDNVSKWFSNRRNKSKDEIADES